MTLLNDASHEGAKAELRKNNEKRKKSLNLLNNIEDKLLSLYDLIPGPVKIISEKKGIQSGLTSYEVENPLGDEGNKDSIYGSEIEITKETYYVIPETKKNNMIRPIIMRDFCDHIF
jgi:hypothetical protein